MAKSYLEANEIESLERASTNLRDRLLIRLLFHLGCRVSEALALTVEDIDHSWHYHHSASENSSQAVLHRVRAKTRQKPYILCQVR